MRYLGLTKLSCFKLGGVLIEELHCTSYCYFTDTQTALVGELMQRWDVYISIKAKRQPIQSVIIKSIEQNISCVYEARKRILEFSSQSVQHSDPAHQVGVANGKPAAATATGDFESSGETSFTGSLSTVSEVPNRSVQIPMSFSEDRIASKASFTSSGSYTTVGGGGAWSNGFFRFWCVAGDNGRWWWW